jgi:DNA-binding NarL/FixJ family response regulator
MPAESPRVLIIEDEPQMLRNLATILRAEGFQTLTAAGGREGLEAARKDPPDVILCDLMMPDLDGFGVLNGLRDTPSTRSIPFLFLTARGERDEVRAGMNLGADDYLTKPVRAEDLVAAIRARIKRRGETVPAQSAGREPANAAELEAFGLTPREAEVLFWVVKGKANAEIGVILEMSTATVKKHMEHIFAKLGVENRTSATLTTLQRLGGASA